MDLTIRVYCLIFLSICLGPCLAQNLASPAEQEPEDLHAAVRAGDSLQIQRLLEQGVNPNVRDANGVTPLRWAALEDPAA